MNALSTVSVGLGGKESCEAVQQAKVPLVRNGTEDAKKVVGRKHREKSEADDGRGLESAAGKIGMRWFDPVVERSDL